MGQIIPFRPREESPILRLIDCTPPELHQDLRDLQEASTRFDRMADALMRRDYAEFDRIKGKQGWDPRNPPSGGEAA